MHPTGTSGRHQQNRIHAYRAKNESYGYFNLLTSEALLDKVEELLPLHRERLYPPTETLSMFLSQAMSADRSCQNIVNQAAVQRLVGGLRTGSTYTGGYCRARQRIPLEMIGGLTRYIGDLVDQQVSDHCQGRRVRIVDGTTVSMQDTVENQLTFPQQSVQKTGVGFPISRIVGITCLSSGVLIDAAISPFQGKGSDEQTLLRSLQHTFEPGDIVLGDAYFATYTFIAEMRAKDVDILMEQHGSRKRSTDFRRGLKLGQRDHLIDIVKPKSRPGWMTLARYNALPDSLTVRECKTGGKVLITTLNCPKETPKSDLKALYKNRWNVELDIRNIKTTMGMEILSCKTPDMVVKEIWVYLLAYNLIRLMMVQSALLVDINPRQISFKHCLQLWLVSLHQINILDEEQLYALLLLMAQQRVGNRSGRIEPRAVKRRPKAFPFLMKPRAEAREIVKKNGHPKKLK